MNSTFALDEHNRLSLSHDSNQIYSLHLFYLENIVDTEIYFISCEIRYAQFMKKYTNSYFKKLTKS